ncbi:MAG TPA: hypothetical protein VFO33_03345, partial [Casimicrobiaceae bacterium]|nr:hypothetical protein [Casimicrobiaceae bacterium]
MSEQTAQAFAASDAVVAWCLRNAQRAERHGDWEDAARWAYIGAGTAAEFGHSYLCSAPLEALLLRIGARIAESDAQPSTRNAEGTRRWLHVISMPFALGGHTALARRWIARNPYHERHDVALTFRAVEDADAALADAVARAGGTLHSFNGIPSLLDRAAALRRHARERADVVVLHTHWWDVVPSLAFAVPGGPPILVMNHADHAFWVGTAVADVVVDIRDSGLALTRALRGARSSAVLPVPLEDRGRAPHDRVAAAARLADRSVLERYPILLTIGSAHKYRPAGALDFCAAIARVMAALPGAALIAVGPPASDAHWQRLAAQTGGRVTAVGPDADLAAWHAAADLYLEGFPIGSYTALLEVALAERAFVRKPWLAPPSVLPIDRGALAGFEPPPSPDAYVARVAALAGDETARTALAKDARRAVIAAHCGEGWAAKLGALDRAIPPEHTVGLAFEPPPM